MLSIENLKIQKYKYLKKQSFILFAVSVAMKMKKRLKKNQLGY